MRWPFRRKADAEAGESSGQVAGPTAVGAPAPGHPAGAHGTAGAAAGQPAGAHAAGGAGGSSSAEGSAAVRAPARQWATLPAIPVTIPRTSPLIAGPAPVVPPLRLGAKGGEAGVVEPAVGTVTGLAAPTARAVHAVVAHPVPAAPPLVVRRATRSAPAEVVPLVDAVDEYVGEPREPAEPHRAPAWLRFTPNWLQPSQPSALPGLPDLPLSEPPSFLPPELRTPSKPEPAPKVELPPRMQEVRAGTDTTLPAARKRRPNLGQSRRLGLGAPIPKPELVHPEEQPPVVDGTVETPPQEPPPPPAAPVRVMVDPEPAPEPAPAPEPPAAPAPPRAAEAPPREEPRRDPADRGPHEPPPPPPSGGGGEPVKPVVATYRATAPLRPAPRRREVPRATVVDRVPVALANEVRTRQQADVSAVPVYRGPKVDEAAKARGARAFASGGAVFLPSDAGPVDSPRAKGLLAHELVHAVQQRTFGARLPAPDSPLGQRLEAEAQAAERFYSGESGAVAPPPLIHAPTPAAAVSHEPDMAAAAQLATELAAAPSPALHAPFDAPTTAEVGRIATETARHVVEEWTNPVLHRQDGAAQGQQQTQHAAGQHPTGQHPTPHHPTAGARQTPTFDTAGRREQLVAAALTMRNATLPPGASPVMQLTDEELNAIDRQVIAEAAQHGVTVPSTEPPAQHYEANSAAAWGHAITGQNMNYGFGHTGWREPVGSANSWYGSERTDRRPLSERLADQFGLINENTATQFDTSTWYEPEPPGAKDKKDDAHPDANQPAAHEDNLYGRANPDRSAVDINKIDLDELATRLYDRLRSRLRTELLVDRERAGLLTDFR